MHRAIILTAALFLVACGKSAPPPVATMPPPYTPPAPHDPAVAALIDQLASSFPPHKFASPHDSEPIWPSDSEMDARHIEEGRIWAVRSRLTEMGFAAFPDLVARAKDPRYSYLKSVQAYFNVSVGNACFYIIRDQLELTTNFYLMRPSPGGGTFAQPYYTTEMGRHPSLAAWWEGHKTYTLRELQIENLEWTIQQEKFAGFVDDAQRQKILTPLESRLAALRASR